jgi:hypothetical protein
VKPPRVILSCLQSATRHSLPAYDFWRAYFVNGCREAGLEPLEVPGVDWAEGLVHSGGDLVAWRSRTWDAVLSFVKSEERRGGIAFFLGYLYPRQIDRSAIRELQRRGLPCVNFFCDNVREFSRVPNEYRGFALHWVPEFEAVSMYRKAGLPHLNAPMPCWVAPELRSPPPRESEPATFIGSADILRRDLFGRAAAAGARVSIRGVGWTEPLSSGGQSRRSPARLFVNQIGVVRANGLRGAYYKITDRLWPLRPPVIPAENLFPAVTATEYIRVTREAIVTLGVNRVPSGRASLRRPLAYSRLRDLEAPMMGACYLTEWTAGVEHLYEIGTEIDVYRSPEELSSRLSALQADPARRRAMRVRGQRRALEEHSVGRSLKRICEQLAITHSA